MLVGCAARREAQVAHPAVIDVPGASLAGKAPGDSLETFMAKVRTLASEARPDRIPAATVEQQDTRLAAALLAATVQPDPETFRTVAREYKRLHIADQALEYLHRALRMDRHDAATHDAIARVWRDSGFPNLALGDAQRAVYYAPASPVVRNTFGTILQALGQKKEARGQYELALRLDPAAAYALNNLCYGWILEGDAPKAAQACQQALSVDPELAVAQNNLGILYAATGNVEAARSAFAQSGDKAAVLYNLGIVHLARREYREATDAFKAAQQARPTRLAAARIRQAEALSGTGGGE